MQGKYWLTVLPETKDLVRGIQRAVSSVDRGLVVTPKFDTRGAGRAGEQAGRDLRGGVESQTRGSSFGSMFRLDGARSAGQRAGGEINAGIRQADVGRGVMAQLGSNMLSGAASLGRNVGTAIASGLKAAAVVGGGLLTAGFGAALHAGFSRLTAIDDAKFKLQGLGNSAAQVQAIMDNALAAVKGTAFGLDEAATTAASAVAAGIAPGEQLTNYLKLTADTAAIAGTSLADMGSIFNKVQTSGKAFTGDLNMLSDRGLPVFTWLQNEYKVSGEELSKMVSDGKVDAATFQRVVANNIAGASQKMGGSLRGSLSNLKASFSRFGAELAGPLFAGLQPLAIGFTGLFDKVTAAIKPIMADLTAKVGPWATDMAARMKAWADNGGIERVVAWFERLKTTLVSLTTGEGRSQALQSIADSAKQIGPALQQAGPALAGVAESGKAFGQALAAIGPATLTSVLVPGLTVLAGTLKFVADNAAWAVPTIAGLVVAFAGFRAIEQAVSPIFSALTGAFRIINAPLMLAQTAAIRAQAAAMTQLTAALGANTIAQGANATASTAGAGAQNASRLASLGSAIAVRAQALAVRAVTAAQWLWNAALAANPIGIVVAAVIAVGVALWAFFTKTETGRKLWDKIWTGIKATAIAVWDWLKNTLGKAWEQLQPGLQKLGAIAREAFSAIGNAIKQVWPHIQPAVEWLGRLWLSVQKVNFTIAIGALKALGAVIGWLWTNVVVPAFQGFATSVSAWWNITKAIWDGASAALGWVGDKVMWLWHTVAEPAFTAIGTVVTTWWTGVKVVWDLFGVALDKIGDGVGKFKDGLVTAFNAVKDVITTMWGAIGGIWDKIVNGVGKVGDFLKNAGGTVLHAIGLDGGATGGRVLSGYAGGGTINGPGTGTSDSILGFPAMVRVANGEFLTNAVATMRNLPLLQAINSGVPVWEMLKSVLPRFAGGGLVSPGELSDFASGVEGAPYKRGGVNWGDCSGAVSAVANYATGREPFASRFATASEGSELAARGFKSGLGPAGSLNIGWYNGGPGGGHTAATLPDGTHFEMGGARGNGQFGGSAAGAEDSEFTNHMHLPPEYFTGLDGDARTSGASSLGGITSASSGGGGSYRSATDTELTSSSRRVDSANTAVKNAQQSVDDRTYARDRAQQRVDDLRAKGKDTSDAEHSLEVANRELTDANDRLAKARTKAGEVQDADNTLRTQGVKDAKAGKSGSGSGNSFSDLGKSLWGGLLETVGLDGSVFSNPFEWPTVKSIMAGVNFLGGMLSGGAGDDAGSGLGGATGIGGGDGLGGVLGGIADAVGVGDMLKTIPPAAGDLNPSSANIATPHAGSGAAPGPDNGRGGGGDDNRVIIENAGMSPAEVVNKVTSVQNARTRTTKVWK